MTKPGPRQRPMPRVTALRPARPGRVRVELDGEHWRTVPLDVAARSGLALGLQLDRERLRTLRRELRRSEALTAGSRVLARRDTRSRPCGTLSSGKASASPIVTR